MSNSDSYGSNPPRTISSWSYASFFDSFEWDMNLQPSKQVQFSDSVSVLVLFSVAIVSVDAVITGLRMSGLIGSGFWRLRKPFSLTIISLLFLVCRAGLVPLIISLLPQPIPGYEVPRVFITVVMMTFGLLVSVKSLFELILVLYGVFSTKPFHSIISKPPLTELRRKIQRRIQRKRMPHLVVVITVTSAYKSSTPIITSIKSILNSVYPERFLSIHIIFDSLDATATCVYNELLSFLQRNESPGSSPTSINSGFHILYEKVEFLISKREAVGLCHAQAGALKEISMMYKGHEKNLCVVLMDPGLLVSKDCFVHLVRALEKQKEVVGMTGFIHYTDEKDGLSVGNRALHVLAEQQQAMDRAMESASGSSSYMPSPLTLIRLHKAMPLVNAYLEQSTHKILNLHSYLSSQSFLDVAFVNDKSVARVGFCPIAISWFRVPSSDLHYWTLFLRPFPLNLYRLTAGTLWMSSFSHQIVRLIDTIHRLPGTIFIPLFVYGIHGANTWSSIVLMFLIPSLIRVFLLLVIGQSCFSVSSSPSSSSSGRSPNLSITSLILYPFYSALGTMHAVYMSLYEFMGTREWILDAQIGLELRQRGANGDLEEASKKPKSQLFPDLDIMEDPPLSPNEYPYRSHGTDSEGDSDEDGETHKKPGSVAQHRAIQISGLGAPDSFSSLKPSHSMGNLDIVRVSIKANSDSGPSGSNTPVLSHAHSLVNLGGGKHNVIISGTTGEALLDAPSPLRHSRSFSSLHASFGSSLPHTRSQSNSVSQTPSSSHLATAAYAVSPASVSSSAAALNTSSSTSNLRHSTSMMGFSSPLSKSPSVKRKGLSGAGGSLKRSVPSLTPSYIPPSGP